MSERWKPKQLLQERRAAIAAGALVDPTASPSPMTSAISGSAARPTMLIRFSPKEGLCP